jgi:RimJ/RimL family protein N-acetyltransferase
MLEGNSIVLAPLDPGDISQDYVSWINDPDTYRYLGTKFGQTPSSVRRYVESIQPPNVLCKIVRKADGAHIGNIALHHFDAVHRRMEIGIVIGAAEARGKGFGREACSLIAQFGFDHLNLHKITAGTVADNVGMTRVFQSLGFTIEGTLVEHFFLEGRYHDVHRFGLLRSAFRPVGHP